MNNSEKYNFNDFTYKEYNEIIKGIKRSIKFCSYGNKIEKGKLEYISIQIVTKFQMITI